MCAPGVNPTCYTMRFRGERASCHACDADCAGRASTLPPSNLPFPVGVKGGASSPMNGILFEVVELSSPLSQIHRPSPACGGRLEWDHTLCVCLFRKKSPVFFTFQQKPSKAPYTYENAKVPFPFSAPVLNLALKTKHICISEDPVITEGCRFCSNWIQNDPMSVGIHQFRCFLDGQVVK